MKSDIEIAQEAKMKPITEIAASLGLADEDVIPYFVAVRAASLTAVLECWLGDQKRTHPDDMPQLLLRLMKPGGMPRPRPDGPCRGPSV